MGWVNMARYQIGLVSFVRLCVKGSLYQMLQPCQATPSFQAGSWRPTSRPLTPEVCLCAAWCPPNQHAAAARPASAVPPAQPQALPHHGVSAHGISIPGLHQLRDPFSTHVRTYQCMVCQLVAVAVLPVCSHDVWSSICDCLCKQLAQCRVDHGRLA